MATSRLLEVALKAETSRATFSINETVNPVTRSFINISWPVIFVSDSRKESQDHGTIKRTE